MKTSSDEKYPAWLSITVWSLTFFIILLIIQLSGFFILPLKYFACYFLAVCIPTFVVLVKNFSKLNLSLFLIQVFSILYLYDDIAETRYSFLKDFRSLKPGTSSREVEKIMGRYMMNIAREPADITGKLENIESVGFRHSLDGRFDAEVGIVKFKEGKVVKTELYPD